MGFRKTPGGNIIYDFDFVPKKLIPLKYEDCGYDSCYAVEGGNGERAPVYFLFSGQRAIEYAIVFGFLPREVRKDFGPDDDMCVCSNIQLVATFAALYHQREASWDEQAEEYLFDPTNTINMSEERRVFPVIGLHEAEDLIGKENIPLNGYSVLRSRTE